MVGHSSPIEFAVDRAVKHYIELVDSKIEAVDVRIDSVLKALETFKDDLTRVPTQLDRAITGLRDLFEARLSSINEDIIRINKELEHRELDISNHLRDLLLAKLDEVQAVNNERFGAVSTQFSERDARTEQRLEDTKSAIETAIAVTNTRIDRRANDTKEALDTTTTANKETAAKMEFGLIKQLDAISSIVDTKTNNLAHTMSDLKDRIVAIESRTAGITVERGDNRLMAQDNSTRTLSLIAIAVAALVGFGQIYASFNHADTSLTESVHRLQADQSSLERNSARNPVEKAELDLLAQRLDALSRRLNDDKGSK